MGCVPAEKRQPAAASMAVKKTPSLKQIDSKSRNSNNSFDNNQLRANEQASLPQKFTPQKEGSRASSPKFNKKPIESSQTFEYLRNSSSSRGAEKEVVRVLPPMVKATSSNPQKEDLSKLVSVNSLDIHSRIKMPEQSRKVRVL